MGSDVLGAVLLLLVGFRHLQKAIRHEEECDERRESRSSRQTLARRIIKGQRSTLTTNMIINIRCTSFNDTKCSLQNNYRHSAPHVHVCHSQAFRASRNIPL